MVLSYDSTPETDALNSEILRLEGAQDGVQEMPLQISLSYMLELKAQMPSDKLKAVLEKAAKTHIVPPTDNYRRRSVKAKLPDEQVSEADEIFRSCFNLSRVKRAYFVRVVLTVYYLDAVEKAKNSGLTEISLNTANSSRTDRLMQAARLILNDNPEDRELIDRILEIAEK